MTGLAHVTVFCFAASYALALAFELWNLFRPRLILRVLSGTATAAGLLAHLLHLVFQPLPLVSSTGSLLFLAFILAIFSLYGSVHHQRVAWGLFVLPVVIGVVLLALAHPAQPTPGGTFRDWFQGPRFWGMTHGVLVLLAAVGVSVGFLASLMYFVQLSRLRSKVAPLGGLKLMSLERLEQMNRRAILWAFPLLTLGLLVGATMKLQQGEAAEGWASPKVLSAMGLWLVFAILLYLRYGAHVRGRQVALFTIFAFVVMLFALFAAHPFAGEVGP